MLKREQAQAALAEFVVADWGERRQKDCASLPDKLRKLGETICLKHQDYQARNKVIRAICNLNAADRAQLFAAIFPGISEYVVQTYEVLIPTLPYQSGYGRRAFRSVQVSHHTERRYSWLLHLLSITHNLEQPLEWYAAWAAYLGYYADGLGLLFAAAINTGDETGEQVFEILCDSARGEHEIGAMGRHVVRSLLVANRPEGWQLMENMLVAAQRQEGLRQVILETVDEAHPEAFVRMLRVIVEQNLVRFSATVRAADVWFGLNWDVEHKRWVQESLVQVLELLENPEQRATVLAGEEPTSVYLALWTLGCEGIEKAIRAAQPLLQHARADVRFVAAYFLRQADVNEAMRAIAPSLTDEDLRVAVQTFRATEYFSAGPLGTDWFEQLEAFLQRFSAKETRLEPLVWPWMSESVKQSEIVGQLLRMLGSRPAQRLLPYLSKMAQYDKIQVAKKLIKHWPWTDEVREAIFGLVGDRSSYVREQVLSQLIQNSYIPSAAEAKKFEALLTRSAADLRRGAISLLLKQEDEPTVASAQRLLNASKAPQRLAGLELLDQLQQTERMNCRQLAEAYAEKRTKRTASEQELLDRLLAVEQDVPTLEDALGLAPESQRTPPVCPQAPDSCIPLVSDSTQPILKAIDDLLEQHRTTPITMHYADRTEEQLLGNARWLARPQDRYSRAENLQRLPLAEVWQAWWESRPDELRDEDGLELLRASMAIAPLHSQLPNQSFFFSFEASAEPDWVDELRSQWFTAVEDLQSSRVQSIVEWLCYLYPPATTADILLKAAQLTIASINQAAQRPTRAAFDWRESGLLAWSNVATQHYRQYSDEWAKAQISQLWQLLRWLDEPQNESMVRYRVTPSDYGISYVETTDSDGIVKRMRPSLDVVVAAFEAGVATKADVYDFLLGDRKLSGSFHELQLLTRRKPHPLLKTHPELVTIVENVRDRILSVECTRGDLPTAATAPTMCLSAITGIPTLIKLLQNFGTAKFARGWLRNAKSRAAVFSHLFRASFPAESDTPKDFSQQIKATDIPEQRLIELAVYAPQWARYVEHALGWKPFAEAVWWFHAHTKDNAWQVDQEIRELWAAQIAELTPLSSQDLIDGAVDVGWFQRIYKSLTAARWAQLDEAAKYASGGGGHKRAQLFADTMTGKTDRTTLIERVQVKRHQDAVRALGLLPLMGRSQRKKWRADLLERYEIIQEFLRTSKKFGSQRQASEKLAARIGMENLARTAGFPDPQRLEWAMEGEAITDLAEGPVTLTIDEVSISLSLNEEGKPQISILKKGKPLKAVPAKLKKNPDVKALQERKRSITRQASRIRKSLEQSMCRGDEFTGAELKELLKHPILRPILQRLVFIAAESGALGYPIAEALQKHDGETEVIQAQTRLRIAHPTDLAASNSTASNLAARSLIVSKQWHLWQQQCFTSGQVQPFKQIFRELYVLTATEQQGQETGYGKGSVRYAGHQVNPRQANALLGQRGWIAHPEEGIRRTFHDENLIVQVEFEEGWYTPTEVEGLTLDQVFFSDRTTYKPIQLSAVPPRVFSEVMRDLDLVVSVAHQGGVDPEASASTVEMRAALLRETSRLLKLENVTLQAPYALIEGTLGSYTLHLGSGTVHRQPGGALCIVPVRSQHRGRVFLPFADDDPKTAEVISKALLLAKDSKIQDLTILEQLL